MRTSCILAVILLAVGAPAVAAQSSSLPAAIRAEATSLLSRSPLLEPTMSVVGQARFVSDARSLLSDAGLASDSINSALEATRVIEALLDPSVVEATITSRPAARVVQFRRIVDAEATIQDVTTDAVIKLAPALYMFTAVHPVSGEQVVRRVSCAVNCTVVFDFRESSQGER